jgi:hypothetical protein
VSCSRVKFTFCCCLCCCCSSSPPFTILSSPLPPLYVFDDLLKVLVLLQSQTNTIYGSWWWIKKLCELRLMARLFPFHIRSDWHSTYSVRLPSSVLCSAHARPHSMSVCTPLLREGIVKVSTEKYRATSLGTALLRDPTKMHTGN